MIKFNSMNNKLATKNGYGSFFSFINPSSSIFDDIENHFIPDNRKLFYNGRHAIKYIIEIIKLENNVNSIWIPEYYCQHVTAWIKANYSNVKVYNVNPLDESFIIDTRDFAKNNDIILVNNFWGISNCTLKTSKKKFFVVEDHSHGWLSNRCIQTTADFCFASLRKSVPAPLGGIAWIPNGKDLPILKLKSSNNFNKIWDTILLGMKNKLEFEESLKNDESFKQRFLKLVYTGENMMHNNYDLPQIDKKHEMLIEQYLKKNYLHFKQNNFKIISSLLQTNKNFSLVSSKSTPFGLILHFNNSLKLNHFKNYLISKKIYPSVLWPENNTIYGYFLNIHIDFRYNTNDMHYIANTINNYS